MEIKFDISIVMVLQFIVAIVLPLGVGLVTKYETRSNRKAVLLLALSALTALAAEALDAATNHTTFDLGAGLFAAVATFVIGVGFHYGLWKPTAVTDKVQAVGSTTTEH